MFKTIKNIFMNKKNLNENYKIKSDFLDDFIKLSVFKNKERINIFDYKNDIYDFFLQSDIFEILDDKNYIELSYKNIYEIEEEYFSFFGLPHYFNGYIQVNNSANFLNKNGVKFEYRIYDNNIEFDKIHPNIVKSYKGLKQILLKEQYELLENIDSYNKGENNKIPSEQYNLLNSIRETTKHTSIILSDTLKQKENIVVIDTMTIDFIKNEEGNYDLVPVIKEFSEEENRKLQEEFKKRNFGKDFYTVNINGKKTQVVFNSVLKKDINKIKKNKTSVTEKELINKDIPTEISEYTEINWSERVKKIGYLPYRPSPPANTSDIDWFSKGLPSILHDEGSIKLTPDNLDYLQERLDSFNEEEDKTVLEFETEEGKKFINIGKDNLENELNKLKNSIIDFTRIKSKNKLQEIIELMKNSEKEYIEYEGKYIQNEKDISILETYINDMENNRNKKDQKIKKEVLLIKDNLETNEYTENNQYLERFKTEEVEIPNSLKEEINLYEYQKEGVLKLQSLYKQSKINGILFCDDMGLGKTIQILMFLAWTKEVYGLKPALIILPVSLIYNWKNEMEKFFIKNTFSFDVMQGSVTMEEVKGYINKDIILTSYESLRINHIKTANIKWKIVICDEAQKMKNPKTLLTNAIKSQNAEFKIACTATPIENKLEDLWCLADFVKPGLLGNLKDFRKKYVKSKIDTEEELEQLNNELKEKVNDFYIRRMKNEVLKDKNFPNKIIKYKKVKISKKLKKVLRNFCRLREEGQPVLPLIQGMLMSCSHPKLIGREEMLFDSNVELILEESNKLNSIKDILDNVKEKSEKAIIFTKFRKMQEILCKTLNYWYGFTPKIINGANDSKNREDILRLFRKKEGFNILILSPEAAGVGLNIVEANHVIHYTRHWNPAKEEQATDRAYRIGQKKDVFVYYPIVSFDMENTEDITFHSQDDWINKQIDEDVNQKTPEEKLNKIIVRKKRLLRDFFFTAKTDTSKEEMSRDMYDYEMSEDNYITMNHVDSALDWKEFEALANLLISKEYNGKKCFTTVGSGDAGVDGVVLSDNGNILIQSKDHKQTIGKGAYAEISGGKNIYEKKLNIKFCKLCIVTSAKKISKSLKYCEEHDMVDIIERTRLAELLKKHKIKFGEVRREDERRFSLEQLIDYLRN